MKKTLLLFFFSLSAFVAKAGIETTDQISISEIRPIAQIAGWNVPLSLMYTGDLSDSNV